MQSLGDFVRGLRGGLKWSQDDFAKKAGDERGTSRSTLQSIEAGKPVKLSAVIATMRVMGFGEDAKEMREAAILWLRSQGIEISAADIDHAFEGEIAAMRNLVEAIRQQGLADEEIELLEFAAGSDPIRRIIETVKNHLEETSQQSTIDASELLICEQMAPHVNQEMAIRLMERFANNVFQEAPAKASSDILDGYYRSHVDNDSFVAVALIAHGFKSALREKQVAEGKQPWGRQKFGEDPKYPDNPAANEDGSAEAQG